ncbi:MAG: glycosyl transferase, group 1, partial [uncultured bacterium]
MKFTQRSIHSKSNHRYKILVSAYACEPDKGSEPGVGWHWVEAISQKNEVWVLTKRNNRSSIEKELNNNPNPHLHFEYVDLPNWLTFWKKGQRGIRTYYYLWQFAALFRARSLHRNIGFDLGHHVTFVNDWLWTFFAFMPLPFIWGPIGSNPKTPANLLPHVKAKLFDLLRFLFQGFMRCIDPLYWISALRAQVVMTINEQNAGLFPLRLVAKNKIKIVPAIATEINDNSATNIETHEGFYVLFVGRF